MTTIDQTAAIHSFVRETLGCGCPEQVFERIDYDAEWMPPDIGAPLQRLLIGDRLLVYILETDGAGNLATLLPSLVEKGRAERDENGYNRLRIVVATGRPEPVRREAERLFPTLAGVDDKVHLHVLARDRCLKRPTGAA